MSESTVVLKKKNRLGGKRGAGSGPIDRVREIDVEVRNHRLSLLSHVRRRWKISLLQILQLANQRLLWRATGAGIPLDRTLVDHDREGETRVSLRFGHDELCGLVDIVVRTIPINDDAIDSAADHVRDLIVNLPRVGRAVADVHVVRTSEPHEQVSIDLCVRARIEQRVHIHFAYVAGSRIAIGLTNEIVGGAGIVRRLCRECRGGHDIVTGRTYTGHRQQQSCSAECLSKHLPSGAEALQPGSRGRHAPPVDSSEPAVLLKPYSGTRRNN